MVSDNTIGDDILLNLFICMLQHFLYTVHNGHKEISFIVRVRFLEYGNQPLKPHTRIHVLGWQWVQGPISVLIVLNKN